jgi:hypothetical protein
MKEIAPRRPVSIRMFAFSVACGLLVSCITYICAWQTYGSYISQFDNRQLSQVKDLQVIRSMLESHRERVGHFPERLEDLAELDDPLVRRNKAGAFFDEEDREYYYKLDGDSFTLLWLGKDNQLGGEGANADINAYGSRLSEPSLWEFTFELPSGGMRFTAILAGVAAAMLSFRNARSVLSCRALIVEILITVVVTVLVALFIAVVHIPNGH